ncbi:hypothetical protein PS6_000574 [Mucor atramentarius]
MSLLFIGDRGYVTNEHNTSQTYRFCDSKASRPQKLLTKKNKQCLRSVNGISVCTNPGCVLRTKDETHKARDSLPTLAVGLDDLSTVIFGQPIPTCDSSFNESKTEKFKTLTKAFCTRNTFGSASPTG